MSNDKLDPKKVHKFYDKVLRLAKDEFGEDDDRDPRLEIHLVDRTRFERLHYAPIPYSHKIETPEEMAHMERMLFMNLSLASTAVDTWNRCRAGDLLMASKQRERVEAALASKLRLCSMQDCSKCSNCTNEAEVDSLGFIHYDIDRTKPPTTVPGYHQVRYHVACFELDGVKVHWVANPTPRKAGGKVPAPYGRLEGNGWQSEFCFEKDKDIFVFDQPARDSGDGLLYQKPQYVSEYLREWLDKVINSGSETPLHAARPA